MPTNKSAERINRILTGEKTQPAECGEFPIPIDEISQAIMKREEAEEAEMQRAIKAAGVPTGNGAKHGIIK